MKPFSGKTVLRREGRAVEALLILLKQLTAHARWVFAALLVLYGLSGMRTIQSHEQALVLRFGRLQPEVHGPGLLVGLPDPFDRVLRFETGKETALAMDAWATTGAKIDGPVSIPSAVPVSRAANPLGIPIEVTGASEPDPVVPDPALASPAGSLDPVKHGYTLTSDYNLVQGRFVLRYRIENPFDYTVAGERTAELLERSGYRALARHLAVRPIDASLTSDRKQIADRVMADLQEDAARLKLGVKISGFDIVELTPPSQVLAAFEEVVNARQLSKAQYEGARQYQAETMAKVGGDAAVIVRGAEAEAADLVSVARGEAGAFAAMDARYRQSPHLVYGRIVYETLDTVMRRMQSRTLVPVERTQPSLLLEPLPADQR